MNLQYVNPELSRQTDSKANRRFASYTVLSLQDTCCGDLKADVQHSGKPQMLRPEREIKGKREHTCGAQTRAQAH